MDHITTSQATLTIGNLMVNNTSMPQVIIGGKGGKKRNCPLWNSTIETLGKLTRGRGDHEYVFLNRFNKPITRSGIYDIVAKYAAIASKRYPAMLKKRVSPHTIRHTTASHLLEAGVDINTIRAWLGHVSVETTNIYAEVNLEMKAKALESLDFKEKRPHRHWRNDKKLMDFLDNLV